MKRRAAPDASPPCLPCMADGSQPAECSPAACVPVISALPISPISLRRARRPLPRGRIFCNRLTWSFLTGTGHMIGRFLVRRTCYCQTLHPVLRRFCCEPKLGHRRALGCLPRNANRIATLAVAGQGVPAAEPWLRRSSRWLWRPCGCLHASLRGALCRDAVLVSPFTRAGRPVPLEPRVRTVPLCPALRFSPQYGIVRPCLICLEWPARPARATELPRGWGELAWVGV